MKLKERRSPINDVNGYPDYFDDRLKRKIMMLARIKPRDIFYDYMFYICMHVRKCSKERT
ncbi:MAG: hypothetical protein ACR2IS_15445 [Nitrososphaeraceae archaeon]